MKKSELKALIREAIEELATGGQEYMLYSNKDNESLAFGDIGYIAEHLSDYITKGHPEKLPIKSDEQSVKRAIIAYNQKNDFSLMLLKSIL